MLSAGWCYERLYVTLIGSAPDPQGSGPIGTRKSGGAISMAKEGLCVMQQQGAVWGRSGGAMGLYVSMLAVCVTEQWHLL